MENNGRLCSCRIFFFCQGSIVQEWLDRVKSLSHSKTSQKYPLPALISTIINLWQGWKDHHYPSLETHCFNSQCCWFIHSEDAFIWNGNWELFYFLMGCCLLFKLSLGAGVLSQSRSMKDLLACAPIECILPAGCGLSLLSTLLMMIWASTMILRKWWESWS